MTHCKEIHKYVFSIRNRSKRSYAAAYAIYLETGKNAPNHNECGIGLMAAQAVERELNRLFAEARGRLYTIVSPDFGPKFSFYAVDDKDASNKLFGWCQHHSYVRSDGFTVREVVASDPDYLRTDVHNEYVERY